MQKRKKIPKKRKVLDKKLIFSIGIIAIVVGGLVYYKAFFQTSEIKFSLKAAIVDQLGFGETQNPEFNKTATNLLHDAGFNVTYHASENITVDFYRELTQYNYGLIILRTHSALREDRTTVDLFTSEEYTNATADEYRNRYGTGVLVKGEYLWQPGKFYFAITSKFIENLEGYFPKSIVIAMGCWSLKPGCEQMAMAFIKKGAQAYIGWNDTVTQQDTDYETVKLLKLLLEDNDPLGNATLKTSAYETTIDSQTVTTHLDYYPKSAANLTIYELIKEAKGSLTLQSVVNSIEPSPPIFCIADIISHKLKDFKIRFWLL